MTSNSSSRRSDIWITQFNLQTTPCLPLAFVRIHQMAPPRICGDNIKLQAAAYSSFIYPERMKGWVGLASWLTYSGRFTHISGHPSAVGRATEPTKLVTNVLSLKVPISEVYSMVRTVKWNGCFVLCVQLSCSVTSYFVDTPSDQSRQVYSGRHFTPRVWVCWY